MVSISVKEDKPLEGPRSSFVGYICTRVHRQAHSPAVMRFEKSLMSTSPCLLRAERASAA